MDLLMNDLSLHGQFRSTDEFIGSVDKLMEIRRFVRRAGREFYCHRGMHYAQVTGEQTMQQAIQDMPLAKQRAWMQWITNTSLHWQSDRLHSADH